MGPAAGRGRGRCSPDTELGTKADLRADLARLEQRLTLRIVTIAAIGNGIMFVTLRNLPPAI